MRIPWSKKLIAVVCMFCLAYGMLSGASVARGAENQSGETEPQETQNQTASPEPSAAASSPSEEPSAQTPATPEATASPSEEPASAEETTPELPSYDVNIENLVTLDPTQTTHTASDNRDTIPTFVNETALPDGVMVNGLPYLDAAAFFAALGENAQCDTQDGSLTVSADGLSLTASEGDIYFTCNDRCLYTEDTVRVYAGKVWLPADELAKCVGGEAVMDLAGWSVQIRFDAYAPLENGDSYYDSDDLYWMSHVIYAESGNQCLEGQLAVGDVVLNRIASDVFPHQHSITEVIFATGQFDVVAFGTIYMTPASESVVAAKLALEGYNIVPDALFFATFYFGPEYLCVGWIGEHCFMTLA